MKTLYALLLALPCCTGALAQYTEHVCVPLLREGLVWVGECYFGKYHIQIEGDTVVNGVVYKKVHRRLSGVNGEAYPPVHDMQRSANVTLSESTPVACIRVEGGRVYRLCETSDYNPDNYNRDWDDPEHPEYTSRYSLIANAADTHYEVVMYDYGNPNVYLWPGEQHELHYDRSVSVAGEGLKVFKEKDIASPGPDDGSDSWYTRYEDYSKAMLMVEGLGMLRGGWQGRDWLCPCRKQYMYLIQDYMRLGTDYVRDSKGNVLAYEDYKCVGESVSEDGETTKLIFVGDPYDFDNDGSFDIGDVNMTINIMLGKGQDIPEWVSADLTFDGCVDIEDLNLVINRLLSGVKPVKYSELLAPESE